MEDLLRLGDWAAMRGPMRDREDMRSEAIVRVLETLAAGQGDGLVRAALDGARAARLQAEWLTTPDRARRAIGHGVRPPERLDEGERFVDVSSPACDGGLGEVLERLVNVVAAAGGDGGRVRVALEVLCDSVGVTWRGAGIGGRRSSAFDVTAASMALASGLSASQCAALKVLVVGERARTCGGREIRACVPGLLARVHGGDERVWSDPRVARMVRAIVDRDASRLMRPWSSPRVATVEPAAARMAS